MPSVPIADPAALVIGRWHVDPALDTLSLDGRTVKLEPRAMRLLAALARRPGAVFSTADLLDTVWPGLVVTGQSLYQAIGELRSVLRADAATGDFIVTVPRKGYRLVAPVSAPSAAASSASVANALPSSATRSIAVLPFRDLGLPPDLTFLRETLLAGLVQELSRQPGLVTIARGTMLSYMRAPAAPLRVAGELGVRYVVDGTLAVRDGQFAIACELIDAASGAVVTSDAIELPVEMRRELARRVVGRLARALRMDLLEHASRGVDAAERLPALDFAMRAWVELYCRPQSRETNDRAWAWAAEAIRLDASIAAAWNAVAYCEWRAAQYGWHAKEWADLLTDAVDHAQRAASLDPSDPDAHYTLGLASYTCGEIARAEATLRHCLQISASYAPAYGLLGLVRAVLGHPEETADWCTRAHALSPLEPLRAVWYWSEACALSMLGREADALDRANSGIAANPDYPNNRVVAGAAAWRLGSREAAVRHVAALRNSSLRSIERLRLRLPPMRVEPWATSFLADLRAAGMPER